MQPPSHPLTPGVTVIYTRHLGPYKLVIRAPFSLWQTARRWTVEQAAERSAALDRRRG
ncbi:hypothetical protein AB0J14_04865 [Micromonospora arborensis]|uniref:hypothetical protein n=1 Tax=Micromonospora arborensis TaxID=2116518 RepID=UPI00340DF8E0